MLKYQKKSFIFNGHNFFKAFSFASVATGIFYLMCISTSEPTFLENGYTGGSDDFTYLANVESALLLSNPDWLDLIKTLSLHTEHAIGYPIVLYLASKVASYGIFLAVFLNFYAVYFIGLTLMSWGNIGRSSSPWKLILLAPGIIFVGFHAYKDIVLLLITLLAIRAFKEKQFVLGLAISLVSNYFRPLNFVLIIFSYLLFIRWQLIIFLSSTLVVILYLFSQLFYEVINPIIQTANDTAYRDLQTYGSSYKPSGNLIFDYFLGMLRFIFLPVPWAINFEGQPFFLSILEFFQSIIIWLVSIILIMKPKIFSKIFREYGGIFWYCLLQASAYSVLYFGNAQPRFRVYIYVMFYLAFVAIIDAKNTRSKE